VTDEVGEHGAQRLADLGREVGRSFGLAEHPVVVGVTSGTNPPENGVRAAQWRSDVQGRSGTPLREDEGSIWSLDSRSLTRRSMSSRMGRTKLRGKPDGSSTSQSS
jgi:hypothetical protein